MSSVERELIEKISRLDEAKQRQVLQYVESIEAPPKKKHYTARELMKLPREERERLMAEAFELAKDEDFEIFEANAEDDWDDYT
jgi:mRNA-degrading endonuclease RelE of RelBE toxin-antitoxin system